MPWPKGTAEVEARLIRASGIALLGPAPEWERLEVRGNKFMLRFPGHDSLTRIDPSEAIAKSIENPSEMTFADFMVADAYLYTAMNMFHRNYLLAREGMFNERDWHLLIDSLGTWFLGNEFGRAWWNDEARHFFEPNFVAYMDQHLAKGSNEDSQFYWLKIKTRLTRE